MTDFTFHTEDTAPAASKPLVATASKAFGFFPNLLAGMAEAPALLEGYMTLSGIFNKTDLTETERQIILMTNNRLNGCTYCMAAHTTISQGAKVPGDVIKALRSGGPIADAKLEALRQFTIAVNEKRGWVDQDDLDAFLAAGYTKQTVLEVVLGTSLKVMSNYTNHIADTPVDSVFQANAWSGDIAKAS
ncbi:MAG: carboxymuconolactone decarboxylase family protein [Pseudomonadota bacterium]